MFKVKVIGFRINQRTAIVDVINVMTSWKRFNPGVKSKRR